MTHFRATPDIYVSNISVNFGYPATACVNAPVTFTNTSTTHIANAWNFGDGGTDTSTNPVHTYAAAGTYNVTLVIFDGYCYDTVIHSITILPGPATSFTINPAQPCPAPVALTFSGSAPPGTTVNWLYGDGTTGTGATTTHIYAHNGVDTISMIGKSASGCIDTIKRIDTLYDMIFKIVDTPNSGCIPLVVSFSTTAMTTEPTPSLAMHPYPYAITSYSWNFGDGSPLSSSLAPTHTYNTAGVFTVVGTALTANGCTITDTTIVYAGTPPVVTFTATPTHICAGRSVLFTATATGPVTVYVWNFGDGTTQLDSTNQISHGYLTPGVYSATVTAYYNGCPSAPFVQTNYITVDSPSAFFSIAYTCSPPTQVTFTYGALGASSYLWIFGDGTTSTVLDPVHNYPSLSSYTAELTTYNAASG